MALSESNVSKTITEFVVTNYLFGNAEDAPEADTSLLGKGIIDSTGILELIEFLESEFQIQVSEAETVPENMDSIANLTSFVTAKTASA